jgi:hypothetical protein
MDIKLFSDLIDALGKVMGGLKTLSGLPKSERDRYRQMLDDTDQLIISTLTMIILRLGDILRLDEEDKFLKEVYGLDNYGEWLKAEQAFRLCKSLREAVGEAQGLSTRLAGKISVRDWDSLLAQMGQILAGERDLAAYINFHFADLASKANQARPGAQGAKDVRTEVEATRDALKKERELLLRQEVELLNMV